MYFFFDQVCVCRLFHLPRDLPTHTRRLLISASPAEPHPPLFIPPRLIQTSQIFSIAKTEWSSLGAKNTPVNSHPGLLRSRSRIYAKGARRFLFFPTPSLHNTRLTPVARTAIVLLHSPASIQCPETARLQQRDA